MMSRWRNFLVRVRLVTLAGTLSFCAVLLPTTAAMAVPIGGCMADGFPFMIFNCVVDAWSSAKAAITSALDTQTTVQVETAKLLSQQKMFSQQTAAMSVVSAANVYDTQDTMCRLHTARAMTNSVNSYKKAVERSLEGGVVDLGTRRGNTPKRIAVAWLYRLCKNGQLAPTDFGPAWFAANGCIEDKAMTHAFLNPATVWNHPVLVRPSRDQLDVLHNPESAYPPYPALPGGTPETILPTLTTLQKWYIGAELYCDNLAMSQIRPLNFTGDQAMMPGNMMLITRRWSALGRLNTRQNFCHSEVARRVGIDANDPMLVGDPAVQRTKRLAEKTFTDLTTNEGVDPTEIRPYLTDSNGDPTGAPTSTDPNPSAELVDNYTADYCNSQNTANSLAVKGGGDAKRAKARLRCTSIAATTELQEVTRKTGFLGAALGETLVDDGPEAGPAKVRYDSDGWRRRGAWQDAAVDEGVEDDSPALLRDMLQAIDAAAHPTQVAATKEGAHHD